MNLSGEAVGAIARMYKIPPSAVIAIVDDVALPLGRLRLRLKGSAGGHHGLESIEAHLSTREYPRIRIGVGAPIGSDMYPVHYIGSPCTVTDRDRNTLETGYCGLFGRAAAANAAPGAGPITTVRIR